MSHPAIRCRSSNLANRHGAETRRLSSAPLPPRCFYHGAPHLRSSDTRRPRLRSDSKSSSSSQADYPRAGQAEKQSATSSADSSNDFAVIGQVRSWLHSSPDWIKAAADASSLSTESSGTRKSLPSHLSVANLVTNHIATASSTASAQRATIRSAMSRLSRRDDTSFGFDALNAEHLRFGKVVWFRDEDEKARGIALAAEHAQNAAGKLSLQKKKNIKPQNIEFSPAPRYYRDQLIDKTLRGKYDGEKSWSNNSNELLGKDRERLMMNGSFNKKPSQEFSAVVQRISGR